MNKSISLTTVILCITTMSVYSQTEVSRHYDSKGNLQIKWSDGKVSHYEKDPTGKENLKPEPKVAERHYDSKGNRQETNHDGTTRVWERPLKVEKPTREPVEKPTLEPVERPIREPRVPREPRWQ